MLKRTLWMLVLVTTMVVGMYWIDRTLEYAAPIHIIAISALSMIALLALLQVVGLRLISQQWVDEVYEADEEQEQRDKEEFADARVANEIKRIHDYYTLTPKPHIIKWKDVDTDNSYLHPRKKT